MYQCNVCELITNRYFHKCPDCGVEGTKTKLIINTIPKSQLEILISRYSNKIKWLEEHATDENRNKYKGTIDGFMTAIADMEDTLDGIPQQGVE